MEEWCEWMVGITSSETRIRNVSVVIERSSLIAGPPRRPESWNQDSGWRPSWLRLERQSRLPACTHPPEPPVIPLLLLHLKFAAMRAGSGRGAAANPGGLSGQTNIDSEEPDWY